MLKKLLPLCAIGFAGLGLHAQTIVQTAPQNRKVILEEFTGINCVYCPQGHAIAQQMKDNNPDDVFLINIHVGGFASPGTNQPDFRTQWGDAIAGQTGLTGYPSGTINRQNFPGSEMGAAGTTALGRGQWSGRGPVVRNGSSYVNTAVTATMDAPSNTMTILVEAYYTGDSPEASNFLNLAILQNNTLGPQTGGNAGNNYNHQHRLIDMVTGQFGEEVTTTSTGNFVSRSYSYNPPSDVHGVPVNLNELEIVAFMTETTQYIISGNGSAVTLNPLTSSQDASVVGLGQLKPSCADSVAPKAIIRNTGTDAITSLNIGYNVNGGISSNYAWTGNLASLESAVIQLPAINYASQASNIVIVTLADSDDDNSNNSAETTFSETAETAGTLYLSLRTDAYGSEVRFNVKDSNGTVVYEGGPFPNNTTILRTFNLPVDCFTFNLIDTYGDGGRAVSLTDANGFVVYSTNGQYGAGESTSFRSDGILGLDDNDIQGISIYPNPATTTLNISNAERSNVEVYDMLGKLVLTKTDISFNEQIDVARLQTGTYVIKISQDGYTKTERFIVTK